MTHTHISQRGTNFIDEKTGKNPTVFKEFSEHCLCLVLSEDGTAIVCKSTTPLTSVYM